MVEPVELPTRIGILPFRNKVLLPGAIIRIQCTSPNSVKLVEQELWQREEKGLIGILPVRDAAEAMAVGDMVTQGADSGDRISKNQSSESNKVEGKSQQEPLHWHTRGVAARALHLSRGVEKPSGRVTYIVVLEGLSRFSVQELNTRGTYTTARISPIDMTKSGILYNYIFCFGIPHKFSTVFTFVITSNLRGCLVGSGQPMNLTDSEVGSD